MTRTTGRTLAALGATLVAVVAVSMVMQARPASAVSRIDAQTTVTSLPVQYLGQVSTAQPTTTLAIMNSPYVAAGSSFGISGSGFLPSQQLQAFLFSTPMLLGTVVSDFNGNYQALFNIPNNTPAGPHTVVVQGLGRSGSVNESVATIVVTAAATQPTAGSSSGYGTGGAVLASGTPTAALTAAATAASTAPAQSAVIAARGPVAYTGANVHGPLLAGSLLLVIGLYLSLAGYLRDDLLGRRAS